MPSPGIMRVLQLLLSLGGIGLIQAQVGTVGGIDLTATKPQFAMNAHQYGGIQQARGTTADECYEQCLRAPTCIAMDYDNDAKLCFHHDTSTGCSEVRPLDNHIHLRVGSCDGSSRPLAWFQPNTKAKGDVSTLLPGDVYEGGDFINCTAACLKNATCTGVDYRATPRKCELIYSTSETCTTVPSNGWSSYTFVSCPTYPPTTRCETAQIDLVFLIDGSSSVCNYGSSVTCQNWNDIVAFITQVATNLNIGPTFAQIGAVIFSTNAVVMWELNRYSSKPQLLAGIARLSNQYPGGTTNTLDAFTVATSYMFGSKLKGDRVSAYNIIILITDGPPNVNPESVKQAAQVAKDSGIRVITLGVTQGVDVDYLRDLSSQPQIENQDWFSTTNFQLNGVLSRIVRQVCDTDDEVVIDDKCKAPLDLVFIVDGSGSLCDVDPSYNEAFSTCDNWKALMDFLMTIVRRLEIGGDTGARIGLVLYSTRVTVEFDLDDFSTESGVTGRLQILKNQFPSGTTNTAAALETAAKEMFGGSGDRYGVPNIAVLVSDGKPNVNEGSTQTMATLLKEQATLMVVVPLQVEESTLKYLMDLASAPTHEKFIDRPSPDLLYHELKKIKDLKCAETTTTPKTPTPAPTTKPAPTTTPTCPGLDVLFLVDGSGSICDEDPTWTNRERPCNEWRRVVDFVAILTNTLEIRGNRDNVALTLFSDRLLPQWNLGSFTDKTQMLDAILRLENNYPGGTTNAIEALKHAGRNVFNSRFDRSNAPNFIIIVTDGKRFDNPTVAEANYLKSQGIRILVIESGVNADQSVLTSIASSPTTTNVFGIKDPYAVTEVLTNIKRNTGNCDTPAASTTRSTPRTTTTTSQNCQADIVYIVDSSGSICDTDPSYTYGDSSCSNWEMVKTFIQSMTSRISYLGSQGIQVGMVEFSTEAYTQWPLNQYTSRTDLENAISNLWFYSGDTNTQGGINKARTEVLGSGPGARSQAKPYAIIITDGYPTINPDNTFIEGDRLKDIAEVFVVVVSPNIETATLERLASSGDHWFRANTFSDIANTEADIAARLYSNVCT